ncbi:glycosyltransferase [Agromyces atrinae]|uniref:Glycosyltransferase n=1 Tax=Agromyces atrinae TaxID=592376 RepID=A0A4Q2MBC1_9MICO|nr:glycosyltransferase [Agromyces atrinae]NYD66709.1 GT2 family glycosyltransferase [Agromyces atrinae]RXZ87371.1 glycosyltransferase [Agromyces atrinae]
MSSQNPLPRVTAVVVAYNRRDLLGEVLDALAVQTAPGLDVVVVDNASSDDSADVARAHGVRLVSLSRNTGGAGGFAAGMAAALDMPADDAPEWLWLMDDDTVPTPTALEKLLAAVVDTSFVAAGSRVIWTDGSEHPMNTPREKPFVSKAERVAAARRGGMAVRSTSFVSMLVRTDVVREVGLPIADYFIWNDDFEYSTRVLRGRRGLHVPASIVVHKTRALASTDADPGERFYNEVRNKLWMLRRSDSLSPAEKALYGASTLRRWVLTFVRSSDRAVLRRGLRRGYRDGTRTRPRPNSLSLAGLSVTDAVRAVEGDRG